MKTPPQKAAIAWLRTEPAFAALGEQAARMAALERDLRSALPGIALTVVSFERSQLVVGAAHAAVAAKVRQIEPSLIAALRQRGWQVDAIRFKPHWRPPAVPIVRPVKAAPGENAVAQVAALALQIRHSGLSEALSRLARRHGG
jgi:hypothetical protein